MLILISLKFAYAYSVFVVIYQLPGKYVDLQVIEATLVVQSVCVNSNITLLVVWKFLAH